jgi:hypothetical protein
MLHDLTEKWNIGIGRQLCDLEKEMYVSIRDPDEEVSNLIAQRVINRSVPISTIHVVLGLVSDQPIDTALELGGAIVACEKIKAEPMVPTKLFGNRPIPVVVYHEFKFVNIPRDANVWVLGVRVNNNVNKFLSEPLYIPDTLWISKGCYHTKRPVDEATYTELLEF